MLFSQEKTFKFCSCVDRYLFSKQGGQIGQVFWPLGYVWKLIVIFWKDEVAQRNDDILGYFLL